MVIWVPACGCTGEVIAIPMTISFTTPDFVPVLEDAIRAPDVEHSWHDHMLPFLQAKHKAALRRSRFRAKVVPHCKHHRGRRYRRRTCSTRRSRV